MLRSLVLFACFLSLKSFAAVGFGHGGLLTAYVAKGKVQVNCDYDPEGGPTFASYYCERDVIETGDYDFFYGPSGVPADKVELDSHLANGKVISKKGSYDSASARSTKSFNLWIATVLQKPLLGLGLNKINYRLYSKKVLVADGNFDVTVRDGGESICSHVGRYWSHDPEDCRQGQFVCNRYFSENNFCQTEK